MRLLGMIGGTSWHSTIVYYRLINELVGDRVGTDVNPPLILYSLNVELMRSGDWDRIKKAYLDYARRLEKAGANAIILCANTPHVVVPYVEQSISIPILHIADATGEEARRLGLRQLGLLGTIPVMTHGFMQSRLESGHGIKTIIPAKSHHTRIQWYVARELTQGKFTDKAKDYFLEQMTLLQEEGAEGIILGCTELPMLLDKEDFDLPMLDTTTLHAQMAVDFIVNEG